MMMVVLPPGGMMSLLILGAGAVLGVQQEIGRSDESTYDHDVCLPDSSAASFEHRYPK